MSCGDPYCPCQDGDPCHYQPLPLDRKALDAAVQAHTETSGFISPFDDAYDCMRAALRAYLSVLIAEIEQLG